MASSRDDALSLGTQVMRRAVIAKDMRTLARSIGEFYLELRDTIDDEETAFSMTVSLMTEFISVGLHMESHDESDAGGEVEA